MDRERELLQAGRELLEREAAYLDEQRWDEWLALFAEDCEYWVPTWRTEEQLTSDAQSELSHIYYASRAGLEDRIARIRSRKSPASTPMARTTHLVGNVRVTGMEGESVVRLRASWTSHVFNPRRKEQHSFFGHAEYELRRAGGGWCIARKKTVLQNDYIPTMIDVYCI